MADKYTHWFESQLIEGRIPPHLSHATSLTKFGSIDMTNNLFRRNKKLRKIARENAILNIGEPLPLPRRAAGTWHYAPERV